MKKIFTFIAVAFLVLTGGLCAFSKTQSAKNKSELARSLNTFNTIVKELYAGYVDTLDGSALVKTAIDDMLSGIDPYTEYYPSDNQDDLTTLAQGQYAGIGSYIMRRGDKIYIQEPQWDSPARNSGLMPGDIIVAIDGDTLSPDATVDKASKRLRGQAGTKVNVTVRRPLRNDSTFTVEITRGNIKVKSVPYSGMIDDGIGYINLSTFSSESATAVKESLRDMQKSGELKGLIIDLRGNGGGYLESAVQIAGYFVPKGTEIVRTRGREASEEKIFKTTQSPIAEKLPLAILIDGSTASASEILSGSMQDLDRAVIIGERSFGKGLVQNTVNLPYGDILKLTRGRYYIPSGRLIQAIDYSRRNPDGSVARTPDSLTNVYRTKAGREVRDGGGITPDIKIEGKKTNRLLYNIVSGYRDFDFANKYQNAHPVVEPDFRVDSVIFEEFKASIDPETFHYDRQSEQALSYLREMAELEGYMNDSLDAQLKLLGEMMHHDLSHDLDLNREAIIEILDTELAARYFSNEDVIRRMLPRDEEVLRAKAVLLDPEEYNKILKK